VSHSLLIKLPTLLAAVSVVLNANIRSFGAVKAPWNGISLPLKAAISNGSINKSVHEKISEEKSFIYLTYHGSLLVYRIN
jgi:hypothetical protein